MIDTSACDQKSQSKTIKVAGVKSFRIFDFHIFDEYTSHILNSSPDSDAEDTNPVRRGETREFIIQVFGINEQGKTVCLYITDYKPFFYVKVGDNWTNSDVNALKSAIKTKLEYSAKSLLSVELEDHKQLYGFTAGKKTKFVKFVFDNSYTMNKTKQLWYSNCDGIRKRVPYKFKHTNLELYESNIPPLLRYFHINNISPSGWVQVITSKTKTPVQKTTTCNFEYICKVSDVLPINKKETLVPYKICSFDIEASSSHGDFPIPKKSYKRLATNIVDIFINHPKDGLSLGGGDQLLSKCLYTAFGYDNLGDVDIVYPKQPPTKQELDKLIRLLTITTIKDAKMMITDETRKILTIDSMFENHYKRHAAADADADADEGDADIAEPEPEPDEFCPYLEEEEQSPQPSIPQPSIQSTKSRRCDTSDSRSTGVGLIDILQNTRNNYTREEKIKTTDEVLTAIFPPLEGDKVTFIGSTFMKYGEKQPYMNHCLVLGTCEEVDGAIIETTSTESELLLKWSELIQTENPDIIIGYNIFGFDYEFMFRRAQENHCDQNFLMLSRKMGEICGKISNGQYEIENTKVALASGEYDLRYYKTTGRLQIDMYTYFRRDYNLASYKLDDVAGQFISDDIKKITHENQEKYGGDVTYLYSQNLSGLNKNDFIHIEISGFTSDYYADGKKFRVLDILQGLILDGKSYNTIVIRGHHDIPISKFAIKWGMAKDDVSPQDIFRLANGSASDRAIVAKYCIQDCNLVHHLLNKIDVLTGYIEMSRICSVPISFLVFRGQGIKLTSYVAKKCREKGTLMPDLEKSANTDGYEGAIVLPPKCSMYTDNPVACVDYSSLYPSSMISNNLSHDSKVWTKEYNLEGQLIKSWGNTQYDNLPGYQYVDIEFDTFRYVRKTPTSRAEKVKSGTKICRWAQLPENQKSIMPAILEELLKARSDTRKMIKTEKDPFMQNILDKRQLGYKVTANSLYGQCGARTSTFYEQDVAASTTATGRMMIIYARRIIEEVYGDRKYETESHGAVLTKAEYVYGDSVAEYTPVLIRYKHPSIKMSEFITSTTFIMDIPRRCGNENWVKCTEPGKEEKEYCELKNVESWTEKGWTPLHRVIRHKLATHKKMCRIVTDNGIVDVTDDHSLLTTAGIEISPNQCTMGAELLHHPFDYKSTVDTEVLDELLEYYKTNYKKKEKENIDVIENTETHYEEKVNAFITPAMLNLSLYEKIKKETITKSKFITIRIDASTDSPRDQLLVSVVYTLLFQFDIRIKTSYSKYRDEYILTYSPDEQSPQYNNKIKYIQDIPYDGYVYDLTTENHHFAAGIGNLIVHNTDSVFFTFNLQDPKTGEKIRGKKALEITIEIAQDAAKLCTDFLKPPMALAYEKTLMPFILLSKKRYVGMLYEEDPNKGKLKYMGLSLKRRDSCDYLKDVYGGILNILMKKDEIKEDDQNPPESSLIKATKFLDQALNDLIQGKVPMEKLLLTRALRSDYKNPKTIAHKVLADRISQRDPGNKPKSGDRIKFLFIQTESTKKTLMGDRIETPDFIIQNNLKIDYNHYITNQLMKPIQQLFGLALEQIWESQRKLSAIKKYKQDIDRLRQEYTDYEIFMKKKEKYCSDKIKVLLFDKILQKISNEKNRLAMITNFFVYN
jgi:DNA polymerase elongation subunit (family B)